jgi:hypothetical protein
MIIICFRYSASYQASLGNTIGKFFFFYPYIFPTFQYSIHLSITGYDGKNINIPFGTILAKCHLNDISSITGNQQDFQDH